MWNLLLRRRKLCALPGDHTTAQLLRSKARLPQQAHGWRTAMSRLANRDHRLVPIDRQGR
jgi:hypothetical protein